jgi:TrpR-related protein YerC/YecD
MAEDPRHEWQTTEIEQLFEAILSLRSTDEASRFFRDLCTLAELESMAHRWQVAELVDRGLPYRDVAKLTGASTATVTRVGHWLRHGEGGYQLALSRRKRKLARTA